MALRAGGTTTLCVSAALRETFGTGFQRRRGEGMGAAHANPFAFFFPFAPFA